MTGVPQSKDPRTVWLVLGVLGVIAIGLYAVAGALALMHQQIPDAIERAATYAAGVLSGTLIDPRSTPQEA